MLWATDFGWNFKNRKSNNPRFQMNHAGQGDCLRHYSQNKTRYVALCAPNESTTNDGKKKESRNRPRKEEARKVQALLNSDIQDATTRRKLEENELYDQSAWLNKPEILFGLHKDISRMKTAR